MADVSQEWVVVEELAPNVVGLALNRIEALNALSVEMVRAIDAGVGEAVALRPGVLVVSSRCERAFSVGADLKERAAMTSADLLACRGLFLAAYRSLIDLPFPVIAALNGFVMGGGLELALTCDLVVADESAVVGLPEVTIGLIPGGGGTQLLARRVGLGAAADLILTGRRVTAGEAFTLGIVDRVVPVGTALEHAVELGSRIAAASPSAVRGAKQALREGWDLPLVEGLAVEDTLWREAATSADRDEGIRAFVEKRPPIWPSRAGSA